MNTTRRFTRYAMTGLVALTLALGGLAAAPTVTLAGFSTSPRAASAKCTSGNHFPEAVITMRKSGEGQKDY